MGCHTHERSSPRGPTISSCAEKIDLLEKIFHSLEEFQEANVNPLRVSLPGSHFKFGMTVLFDKLSESESLSVIDW